jgi:GNAT superfamily N-acetyltransferase
MRSSDVVVRSFTASDAASVAALIAVTMRQSNSTDYPSDRLEALIAYFTADKLGALAEERDCLVAVSRHQVVGTAARDNEELVTFFVRPDWQRRGVGTRLLEQLERRARELGLERLHVEASITGAGFYERRGYQRTGAVLAGTAGRQITMTKVIISHR